MNLYTELYTVCTVVVCQLTVEWHVNGHSILSDKPLQPKAPFNYHRKNRLQNLRMIIVESSAIHSHVTENERNELERLWPVQEQEPHFPKYESKGHLDSGLRIYPEREQNDFNRQPETSFHPSYEMFSMYKYSVHVRDNNARVSKQLQVI